jgi:thymidylate synthase (FAD)
VSTTTTITTTSAITVRAVQRMGGDHMVVAAARVSTCGTDAERYAAPAAAGECAGLIGYLMKHRHGTPFEHSALTFYVHAPAFVWWEWTRHRIGHSFNLESARYRELPPVFWVPREDRPITPDAGHKAARPKFKADPAKVVLTARCLAGAYEVAYSNYRAMLANGVASEVARACLPFAVYYSGWVTANPRSLMHFLSLRTHEPAATFVSYPQAEIEEAARAVELLLAEGWPVTHAMFVANGRGAP